MKRILPFIAILIAACQAGEPQGYVTLSLPTSAQMARLAAVEAPAEAPKVTEWVITVSAEDMAEPIVVRGEETTVTIPVKAGPARIVHVAGRSAAVDGVTQGYDGETVVDVAPEGDTAADVDVFRSVTVKDTNAPVTRSGNPDAAAPDVDEISITLGADSLLVFVTFLNDVAAPWNSSQTNSLRGLVEFDTDRIAQTGKVSLVQQRHRALSGTPDDNVLGVEFAIDLTPVGDGYVKLLTGDTAKPVAAQFGARTLSFNIPYDYVGGKFSSLRFAALLSNKLGSLDFLPETGYVDVSITNVAAPLGVLQAVNKFTGNFVTRVASGQYIEPALVATPAGFTAAWHDDAYFYVAASENGEVFSTPMRAAPALRKPVGVDVAVDDAGTVFLAGTVFDRVQSSNATVYRVEASLLAPADTADVFYMGGSRPAQIEAKGGVAFVTDPISSGGVNVSSIVDGKLASTLSIGGGASMVPDAAMTRAGDSLIFAVLDYLTGIPALKSLPAVSPFGTFTALPAITTAGQGSAAEVAVVGDKTYVLVVTGGTTPQHIRVYANGVEVPFAGRAEANLSANSVQGEPQSHSYPKLLGSASGRVGVVWHLAHGGVNSIYYAELLPGASAFSAPLLVGAGNAAALAFDVLERPVVLLSDAHTDSFLPTATHLVVYRGQ